MRYYEVLNEVFDTKSPVIFSGDKSWYKNSFSVDDLNFELNFIQQRKSRGVYQMNFGQLSGDSDKWWENSYEIGNTGLLRNKAIRVFSKVVEAFIYFLKNYSPAEVSFDAVKEDGRDTLYRKMIATVAKNIPGYTVSEEDIGTDIKFRIIKN